MLWHEFCHVVTLEKTNNRMPRWLSEGISVYEETQRDQSWGESMTPSYREMLLSDDLTPVSDLSAAFLNPKSPLDLQFAYYQSSLVVEFLIDQHGIDALKQILVDLGDGLPINDALARNVGSLEKLDSQFADYAKKVAADFGADADWSKEDLPERPSTEQLIEWVDEHPDNYWGLRALAGALIRNGRTVEAIRHLEKLRELGAVTGEQGGPLEMLAAAYRKSGNGERERETLEEIVSLSSDALPALERLIQMASKADDWESVQRYSEKSLSINPLVPSGQLSLGLAAEKLQRNEDTVRALGAHVANGPLRSGGNQLSFGESLGQVGSARQSQTSCVGGTG